MRNIIRAIDFVSEHTGRVISWTCVALILVLVYEVTARYLFNSPTIWAHQLSCMVSASIAALGWGYTHRHHGHVRVDIFYTYLPPRGKAIIDVILALLLFFPLTVLVTMAAFDWMVSAWSTGEVFIESYWYPPAGPIRTAVFLGLCVFILQGAAEFIRDLYRLIRNKGL